MSFSAKTKSSRDSYRNQFIRELESKPAGTLSAKEGRSLMKAKAEQAKHAESHRLAAKKGKTR